MTNSPKGSRKKLGFARKPRRGEVLLSAEGICKGFPGVWEHLILDNIDFDVRAGEIHAVLGENGAGKTVLANVLSGFYSLTKGKIYVKGKPVSIKSPKDALKLGIGMVHQEFTLARPLTVAENVALGLSGSNFSLPLSKVEEKIRELSKRYQLEIDPKAKIEELSVGEQQRAEIIKALYHEPQVLILDEPTSTLTPDEAKKLFSILRAMAREGHGIVFITHRLEEVMEVSDRVTVLRLGKKVGTRKTSETTRRELVRMMMGAEVSARLRRKSVKIGKPVLEIKDLQVMSDKGVLVVKGITLSVREGEILGIAGVSGNGQSELVEAITGLRRVKGGKVLMFGKDVTNCSPRKISDMDVAHIPEERRRMGTAEGMTVAENLLMKDYRKAPFCKWAMLNKAKITQHANKMVAEYKILVPDLWQSETRILSGGNIQRLILARETWKKPRIVIAVHPTHGLDLKALKHTHELFLKLKERGAAILLVSEDIEEILQLSDRIAVIFDGKIVGTVDASKANKLKLGLMMAGAK
jgi:simple sugar transport system ATP-binding protein